MQTNNSLTITWIYNKIWHKKLSYFSDPVQFFKFNTLLVAKSRVSPVPVIPGPYVLKSPNLKALLGHGPILGH